MRKVKGDLKDGGCPIKWPCSLGGPVLEKSLVIPSHCLCVCVCVCVHEVLRQLKPGVHMTLKCTRCQAAGWGPHGAAGRVVLPCFTDTGTETEGSW